MVGANYMGGKRNAAKARTKDVAYRLHREHFDKQRTNFLVQGLGSQGTTQNFNKRNAINLAHAKRNTESFDSVPPTSGVHDSSESSSPRKSRCQPNPPKQAKSKLLNILENTEPISFRSKRERLLKITDFVGLSTRETASPKYCDPMNSLPQKRRMPNSPGTPPYQIGKRKNLVSFRDVMPKSPRNDLHTSLQTHNSSSTLLDFQEPNSETSEQKSPETTEWVGLGDLVPIHSSDSGPYYDCDVEEPLVSDTAHVSPGLREPLRDGDWYSKRTSMGTADLKAVDSPRDMALNLVENAASSNSVQLSPHDLDMSSDWYAMVEALELPQFENTTERVSCKRPQLGRAGLDFYLSPGSCDQISPLKESSETSPVSADFWDHVFDTNCSGRTVMEEPLTDVPASEQNILRGSHILRAESPTGNLSGMSFAISKSPSKMELQEHNIQFDGDENFTSQNLALEVNTDGVAKGLGCLVDLGSGQDPAHFTSKKASQGQDKRLLPEVSLFPKKNVATHRNLPEDESQDIIERFPHSPINVTLFSPKIATAPHSEQSPAVIEVNHANTVYPSTAPTITALPHELPPDISTLDDTDIHEVQALSRGVDEAAVGMGDTTAVSLVRTECIFKVNPVPSDETDLNKSQSGDNSQRKTLIHSVLPGKEDMGIADTFDTYEAIEMQREKQLLDGPLLFGAEFEEEEYQDDTRIGEHTIQQTGPGICRTDIVVLGR